MELLVVLILGLLGGLLAGKLLWHTRDSQPDAASEGRNAEMPDADTDNSFDYGLKMYRVKRFDDAFPVLLYHAGKGHTQACSLIAKMYYAGNGVEKSESQYRYWMLKAAQGGDKAAKAISKRLAK